MISSDEEFMDTTIKARNYFELDWNCYIYLYYSLGGYSVYYYTVISSTKQWFFYTLLVPLFIWIQYFNY